MSAEGMQITVIANGLIEALKKDGVNLDDRLGKNASNYVREIVAHLSQPQPVAQGEAVAKQIRGSIIRRLDSFRESKPSSWCGYLDDAIGAAEVIAETLEKNSTPTIPAGHRVVPIEPTEAMRTAGYLHGKDPVSSYKAMLAVLSDDGVR